jgi:hypothetical protein
MWSWLTPIEQGVTAIEDRRRFQSTLSASRRGAGQYQVLRDRPRSNKMPKSPRAIESTHHAQLVARGKRQVINERSADEKQAVCSGRRIIFFLHRFS